MARSSGPVYIVDNSVTAINDALNQLMFMIDEVRGEHDNTTVIVGPHTHAGVDGAQDGGPITPDASSTIDHDDLTNVTTDQHHAKLHETSHREGGLDELKLDDAGTPEDNTDNDSTTSHHGLLPKLSGNSNEFLNGQGAYATVTAAEATDIAMAEAQLSESIWEKIFSNDGSVTITVFPNADAIDLAASGTGGSGTGKQFVLMMADL